MCVLMLECYPMHVLIRNQTKGVKEVIEEHIWCAKFFPGRKQQQGAFWACQSHITIKD